MALAVISDVRSGPAGPVLRVDTGTNAFYQWRVGLERQAGDGEGALSGVTYESPIARRVGVGAFQTAFDLPIDAGRVDRRSPYVQVVSYKDAQRRSPAWSRAHRVYGIAADEGGLMAAELSHTPPGLAPARVVPFSVHERPLSGALFWSELVSLVDDLAPLANEVLKLAGDEDVQAGASDLLRLLAPLLGRLTDATAPSPPPPAPQPAPATVTAPAAPATAAPATPAPAGAPAPDAAVSAALDFGAISGPAVLGLISALGPTVIKALGPLLQQAPGMLQAYLDHPIKLLTAIGEINRQEQLLTNQQVQSQLASGDQHLLLNLLGRIGAAAQLQPQHAQPGAAGAMTSGGALRVEPRVDAALVPPGPPPGVAGARSLYAAGRPIILQLRLTTAHAAPDRPIPHAIAHVRFTRAADGSLLVERRLELGDVRLGTAVDVVLDAETVARLPVGVDVTASVDVMWTGRDRATYTTPARATQQMAIVGDYFVAGIGRRTGTELPLTDPVTHRPFWHQVWEGGAPSHRRWELDVVARYYYRFRRGAGGNGRMETRLRQDQRADGDAKVVWSGLLKSGMDLAITEVNRLLPLLQRAEWSGSRLAALAGESFEQMTARHATTKVHLRGRTEQRGSVWVFPVFETVEIDLRAVTSVAPTGAVIDAAAEPAEFLLPVSAVVVGMESEG